MARTMPRASEVSVAGSAEAPGAIEWKAAVTPAIGRPVRETICATTGTGSGLRAAARCPSPPSTVIELATGNTSTGSDELESTRRSGEHAAARTHANHVRAFYHRRGGIGSAPRQIGADDGIAPRIHHTRHERHPLAFGNPNQCVLRLDCRGPLAHHDAGPRLSLPYPNDHEPCRPPPAR